MSYQRDSFPPLPTALITCIILLITLPFLFFYQKSFSKNIIFKKDIKVVVHSISNSTQVKKYINNLPDYAARLPVRGFAPEIGISPQEEVWFATKAGNTYFTKAVGELWHFGPFGSKDEFASNSGETYERVNFFSDDTLMISGFIQGENSVADFVYWSGNHGKTWKKIKFGESS